MMAQCRKDINETVFAPLPSANEGHGGVAYAVTCSDLLAKKTSQASTLLCPCHTDENCIAIVELTDYNLCT